MLWVRFTNRSKASTLRVVDRPLGSRPEIVGLNPTPSSCTSQSKWLGIIVKRPQTNNEVFSIKSQFSINTQLQDFGKYRPAIQYECGLCSSYRYCNERCASLMHLIGHALCSLDIQWCHSLLLMKNMLLIAVKKLWCCNPIQSNVMWRAQEVLSARILNDITLRTHW